MRNGRRCGQRPRAPDELETREAETAMRNGRGEADLSERSMSRCAPPSWSPFGGAASLPGITAPFISRDSPLLSLSRSRYHTIKQAILNLGSDAGQVVGALRALQKALLVLCPRSCTLPDWRMSSSEPLDTLDQQGP